jgi:GT2 family glycosyltransferase
MTAGRRPRVWAVVVNYRRAADTLRCLTSLEASHTVPERLVVIDNDSRDGSAEQIAAARPDVVLLRAGHNGGYAAGNNLGLRAAAAAGADYAWLLNNDTVVAPDALDQLLQVMQGSEDIAFASSRLLHLRSGAVESRGGRVDWRTGETADAGVEQAPQTVAYGSGASLLFRLRALPDARLLPECYFLYFEEVDWQLTAARSGWRSVHQPASVVWHDTSATVGAASSLQAFHVKRSQMLFLRRQRPSALPAALGHALRHWVAGSIRAGDPGRAAASAGGLLAGLVADRDAPAAPPRARRRGRR